MPLGQQADLLSSQYLTVVPKEPHPIDSLFSTPAAWIAKGAFALGTNSRDNARTKIRV